MIFTRTSQLIYIIFDLIVITVEEQNEVPSFYEYIFHDLDLAFHGSLKAAYSSSTPGYYKEENQGAK